MKIFNLGNLNKLLLLFVWTAVSFVGMGGAVAQGESPTSAATDASQPGSALSGWENVKPQATTASNNSQPANVVASGELQGGERVDITELKRTSGDTVTLKFRVNNTGSEELNLGNFGGGGWHAWDLDKVVLLDLPNKKKYFVLKDSENKVLSSNGKAMLKPGAQATLWAKFPAPPANVAKITVEIPTATPFEDLPITN